MLSERRAGQPDRFTIHRLTRGGNAAAFAGDVRAGLSATPRALPPKYFYDDLGSQLFEAICRLPEYYLTRAESEILASRSDEIISSTGAPLRLIELGSGSAEKTRYLIDAILRRQQRLEYVPVDISDVSLESSSLELLHAYPRLSIIAYAADYFTALRALAESGPHTPGVRQLALFLGSNIGNFDREAAREFLREVRKVLRAGDCLGMGADLKKSPELLVAAYDDALGVTAAFNLNLLVRINRELGGDFDVRKFRHRAAYSAERGRMEIHIESLEAQTVRVASLDMEINFARGDTIHTENSYKFDVEQLSSLARDAGFALQKTWYDGARAFSFNLLMATDHF